MVARTAGGREVAGSSPVTPTTIDIEVYNKNITVMALNTNRIPEVIAGALAGSIIGVGGTALGSALYEAHQIQEEATQAVVAHHAGRAVLLNEQLTAKQADAREYSYNTGAAAIAALIVVEGVGYALRRRQDIVPVRSANVARNQTRTIQAV
ncbi:MAG: hypothetical protein JWN82_306 [Candidatus Saccharibacteria bacterium]|nr:hypothetical protein [Candidatus Saccharibacteria bacterium]